MDTPQNTPIAFFDFDDTLVSGDSILLWHQFYFKEKPKKKYLLIFHWTGFLLWALRIINSHTLKRMMLAPLCYETEEEKIRLAQKFARNIIPKYFYPQILDCLWNHRVSGHKVYVLSASPHFYLQYVNEIIDVDKVVGSKMFFPHKGLIRIPKYLTANFKGEEKTIYIREKLGIPDGTSCFGYSDHHTDRYLLEFTEFGFCVHPDKELKALAEKNNWPVLYPPRQFNGRRRTFEKFKLLLFKQGSQKNRISTLVPTFNKRKEKLDRWLQLFQSVVMLSEEQDLEELIDFSINLKGIPELITKEFLITQKFNSRYFDKIYGHSGTDYQRNQLLSFGTDSNLKTDFVIRSSNGISQWLDTESNRKEKYWIKVKHVNIDELCKIDLKIITDYQEKLRKSELSTAVHFWIKHAVLFYAREMSIFQSTDWIKKYENLSSGNILLPKVRLVQRKSQLELYQYSPEGIRVHFHFQYLSQQNIDILTLIDQAFEEFLKNDLLVNFNNGFNLKIIFKNNVPMVKVVDFSYITKLRSGLGEKLLKAIQDKNTPVMNSFLDIPIEEALQPFITEIFNSITITSKHNFDFSTWVLNNENMQPDDWKSLFQLPDTFFILVKCLKSVEWLHSVPLKSSYVSK